MLHLLQCGPKGRSQRTDEDHLEGIARQERQVEEFRKAENRRLPQEIDYDAIPALKAEAREKLAKIRPVSIGQASRISGVSPADVAVLLVWLEQRNKKSDQPIE